MNERARDRDRLGQAPSIQLAGQMQRAVQESFESLRLALRLNKESPHSKRTKCSTTHRESACAVAAALGRLSGAYLGCKHEGDEIGVINLYFNDIDDGDVVLNTLTMLGKFWFKDGFCSLFPSADSNGGEIRLQLAIRSLRILVEKNELREAAETILDALGELVDPSTKTK